MSVVAVTPRTMAVAGAVAASLVAVVVAVALRTVAEAGVVAG